MKKGMFCIIVLLLTLISCDNVIRLEDEENEDTKIINATDLTESENYKGIETCEEGKELAKKELSEGKLRYIFGGFGSKQEFATNLEILYGIEIIRVGGVLGMPNNCYNLIMY